MIRRASTRDAKQDETQNREEDECPERQAFSDRLKRDHCPKKGNRQLSNLSDDLKKLLTGRAARPTNAA